MVASASKMHPTPSMMSPLAGPLPSWAPQPPSAESDRALHWLTRQSVDIVEVCVSHLHASDRGRLSRLIPPRHNTLPNGPDLFADCLLAGNHRAVMTGISPGPLRQLLIDNLNTTPPHPVHSRHWGHVNDRRQKLAARIDAMCRRVPTQVPQSSAQPLFRGFCAALCALDELNDACLPESRRTAGQNALLLASHMDGAMQKTLMAHVVVGVALAFMGRKSAAESVFEGLLQRDVKAELHHGQAMRGLHLCDLMLQLPRFPDRCLMWVKAAAKVTDSTRILGIFFQLVAEVGPIDDRYQERSGLNQRWPILVSGDFAPSHRAQIWR